MPEEYPELEGVFSPGPNVTSQEPNGLHSLHLSF